MPLREIGAIPGADAVGVRFSFLRKELYIVDSPLKASSALSPTALKTTKPSGKAWSPAPELRGPALVPALFIFRGSLVPRS